MKRFSKLFLITLGFGILGAILSIVPNHPVAAAIVTPVNVVNTPLPVAVSSLPPVAVTNTSTAPLFVRDVDNSANEPFAAALCSGLGEVYQCFFGSNLPSSFTVPTTTSDGKAVKELVIEYLDGACYVSTGGLLTDVTLNTQVAQNVVTGLGSTSHFLSFTSNPTIPANNPTHIFEWATPTHIFANPNSFVTFEPDVSINTSYGCTINVSGHLATQ